jgi:shikimate dehydrogenase
MIINAKTPFYALLGHPVSHSLSPLLHNGWIGDYGLDAVYVALDVAENGFETALEGLFAAGLQGGSVTIPFKERAAAYLTQKSTQANAIGSVNCLQRTSHGFLGHTTDGAGLIADLDARMPGWREGKGHGVVIGAGGAAKSVIHGLYETGFDRLHVVNRTDARAQEVCKTLAQPSIVARPWAQLTESLIGASLVINASSAGLNGDYPLVLDVTATHKDAVIYDCVYAPRDTAFLASARAQQRRTCDGLGMLAGQGMLAFEHWFGIRPDLMTGIKRLEAALGQ